MMSGRRLKLGLGLADAVFLTTIIQSPRRTLSCDQRAPDTPGYGNAELHVYFPSNLTSGDQQGKEKRSTCPTLKPLVTSAEINPPRLPQLACCVPILLYLIPSPYFLVTLSLPSSHNGRICTRPDFWDDL